MKPIEEARLSKVFALGAQRQKSFGSAGTHDRLYMLCLRSIINRRSQTKVLQHLQGKRIPRNVLWGHPESFNVLRCWFLKILLYEAATIKRVERCNLLLCSAWVFSVDVKINRRNNRWLAHDPKDVLIVFKTKFRTNVHVLYDVSDSGGVLPPQFFVKDENVTKVYLHVLINIMKLWMDPVPSGKLHLVHLNSPDLNPSHLYVWRVFEKFTVQFKCLKIVSLRNAI